MSHPKVPSGLTQQVKQVRAALGLKALELQAQSEMGLETELVRDLGLRLGLELGSG
jgi:hypothetical protein